MADHQYEVEDELILIPVRLYGKHATVHNATFILDTGSSGIIIDHEIAFDLQYSSSDSAGFSTVSSVLGTERGYRLVIGQFEALGHVAPAIEVRCHDLKDQGVEGLVGMSFLKRFFWCVHPERQIISVA